MKNLLFTILFFLSTICVAQNDLVRVNNLVSECTTSLQNKNINTYLISKRYCIGNVEIFQLPSGKLCFSKGTYYAVYIFWIEEEKYMIKKIDNCGMFETLELNNSNVIDFVDIYKEDIQKNPVKHYEFSSKDSGPLQRTEIHSCAREIEYRNGNGVVITQNYNLFDITNDALEENINYAYNNGLNTVELDKMMSYEIEQIDDLFRRQ